MARPNPHPIDEPIRTPLNLQKSGVLPAASTVRPQLNITNAAAASNGKQKRTAEAPKAADTSSSSNHHSAKNNIRSTNKSASSRPSTTDNQQKEVKGMPIPNGKNNYVGLHKQTSNSSTGQPKGKPSAKAKNAISAPPVPDTVPEAFITSFPTSKAPTLFPKITGDLGLIESRYRVDNRKPNRDRAVNVLKDEATRLIQFIGTVKLHGQHADIVINPDNTIRLQSRNKPALNGEQDIVGFANAMFALEANLLQLKQRFEGRWSELNSNKKLRAKYPLIIAGEWVGPGVQKNVALDELPRKYFVITSISLENFWVDDHLYSDIEDEDVGIVHVARGGFFSEQLDVRDIETCQERMMAVTLEVEKACPFAKAFGIIGRGEGVVWKAAQPLGRDPRMWVKTKGPDFAVTRTADLPKPIVKSNIKLLDDDVIEITRQFAYATTTEPRLQQVWQVMELEYAMPMDKSSKKKFMQYVSDEILREEKHRIKSCKVEEQYLMKCIRWMAEIWYDQRLDEISESQAASTQLEGIALKNKNADLLEEGKDLQPETKVNQAAGVETAFNWW